MKIINLTPHAITITPPSGDLALAMTIQPEPVPARVSVTAGARIDYDTYDASISGVSLPTIALYEASEYGVVVGLPDCDRCCECSAPATHRRNGDSTCPGHTTRMASAQLIPHTIYVVSALVASRCAGRPDVYSPDTGPTAIRDDEGRIVAVRGLVRALQ